MTSRKDANELLAALKTAGYTWTRSRGHYRVQGEGLRTISMPSTPSDLRSVDNAITQLRRAGYIFTFRGRLHHRKLPPSHNKKKPPQERA